MSSLSSIALSGLQAQQLRLQSSAHNIANTGTPQFHRQQVAQQALPGGGTVATIERAPQAEESAGESLADDIVGLKLAGHLFAANLAVLRTQDRLLGALLDVTA